MLCIFIVDLQNKFRVVENEIGNKNEEVQSLHSKLTDTMLSKQQLEQKMVQLVNAEQKRANADDALKIQLQVWQNYIFSPCFIF